MDETPAALTSPQAIGRRLRLVRDESQLSQEDFGARIGHARQNVYRYESGRRLPDPATLAAIAEAFRVDLHWLLTGEGDRDRASQASAEARATVVGQARDRIPVLGSVPAGLPIERALSRYAEDHIDLDVPGMVVRGDTLFALRVTGDSMTGVHICEGDYAVCSLMASFAVGDTVCLYQAATGESTIKQLGAHDRERGRMLLIPHRAGLVPFPVQLGSDDQVRRVVAVVRRLPPVR